MSTKAVKVHKKAQAIKGGAVGAFTQAIQKVNQANDLLVKANDLDTAEADKLSGQILALQQKRLDIMDNVVRRGAEIDSNNTLIERLQQFA
mgnify:CR=1 FL=1